MINTENFRADLAWLRDEILALNLKIADTVKTVIDNLAK